MIDYIHLWGLPSGTNEEEKYNRNANLVRRCNVWRAPIEISPNGQFNPDSGNVVLQHGWTYNSAFNVAEDHGYEVLPCFMIHATGDWDGDGYHRSRPPVLNPNLVENFVGEFLEWLSPEIPLYGWQLGNEVAYNPTGHYTHEKWFTCWERIMPFFPGVLTSVSAGNSGREFKNGELTHNGWLASTGLARQYGIVLDVHGNGLTDSQLYGELTELPHKYPEVVTGMYEDRPPQDTNNRALSRAMVCLDAGVAACAVFGARDSGNPPLSTCRWGTQAHKPTRWHIGLEGCARKWQDGTHGTVDNWTGITQAAHLLDTFVPGTDLPNYIEEEEPPMEPLPGIGKMAAFVSRVIVRRLEGNSEQEIIADPDVRRMYAEWLDKVR